MTQKKNKAAAPKKTTMSWMEQYHYFKFMNEAPIPQAYIEALATELIEWARTDPEAIKMDQFHINKNIMRRTFDRWCNDHPTLDDARTTAKMIFGARRELNGLKGIWNVHMVTKMMHHYDPDWQASEEWRAAINKPSDEIPKAIASILQIKLSPDEIITVEGQPDAKRIG